MSFWSLLLVALGVSADAFAVALGRGLHMRRFSLRGALVVATFFGGFQALMPLIGWALGSQFAPYIEDIDHWVAFVLLVAIGGRMLWEAFTDRPDAAPDIDSIDFRELTVLAVATSIDALAVGISFALIPDVPITGAIVLIGVTTFVTALIGVVLGHRVGLRFGRPAEIVGGIVLIAIGVRILLDHLGVW